MIKIVAEVAAWAISARTSLTCVHGGAAVVSALRPWVLLPTLLSTLLGMVAGTPQTAGAGPRTLLESVLESESASHPDDREAEEESRVDADRPHLPEASTTVGKGAAPPGVRLHIQ